MIGQQYDSFDALLKRVKDIVGDPPPAKQCATIHGAPVPGAQPMDIDQM
jgi:hypothetical protein